jgi:hypothetical protein
MLRKIAFLVVCLVVIGLPIAAHASNRVIFVLVDAKENRAYIPEGTVLPPGLHIRANRALIGPGGIFMDDTAGRHLQRTLSPKRERLNAPPLVFEYAPAERFEAARARYYAKHPETGRQPQTETDVCNEVDVSDSRTGAYDTYYDSFASVACVPSGTLYVNNYYTWTFTATGEYSDDDERIDPYVGISDLNNNFNCYHPITSYEGYPTCNASATTQFTNTACTNTVYTYGLLYKIEYTNDPYHDNYYGFNLEVDWCCAFH